MTTVIEAAFVGDSHGAIVEQAGRDAGIVFRAPITAASAMFLGSSFVSDEKGGIAFRIDQARLDDARVDPQRAKHRLHKSQLLSSRFQSAFSAGLPAYSNIGMTARNFVLGLAAAAKANRQDAGDISGKIARLAAQDYFRGYRDFYAMMLTAVPTVTCVFGPTRFPAALSRIWMAYDDVVVDTMQTLGIEIIDLRAELGDETLQLRPEFGKEPVDDGVHGNALWGRAVVNGIAAHAASRGLVRNGHSGTKDAVRDIGVGAA